MTDDAAKPQRVRSSRTGLTLEVRMALVERDIQGLSRQREREHAENTGLMQRIEKNQEALTGKFDDTLEVMKGLSADHLALRSDVDDLKQWRKGLVSEIRGALKIPKLILAATPVAMFILGVWTLAHP